MTFARSHAAELLSGALLLVMSVQMVAVISRKSITIDELVLIPSAYYHLVDGDFQLVNEHPALPKIIAAIPLLFVQPNEFKAEPTIALQKPDDATLARQSEFWEKNLNRIEQLSFWPRAAMIMLTVGLGVLIFSFARTLFGSRVAVFAVALYSLEPTIVGHGRVVHTDVPAAFGYLLFFMALYFFSASSTRRRAVFLGAAAALAILTKFSMLLLGIVLAAVFVVRWWRSSKRRNVVIDAAIVLSTIVVVINAAYFFKHGSLNDLDQQWFSESLPAPSQLYFITARLLTFILPKEFVLGIFHQFWHNGEGHSAGLLGMYSHKGWWYYFPVAFALKTTVPFLILSLAAIAWATLRLIRNHEQRFAWLLIPTLIYSVFILFSNIDIGVRYLLPIFPFLIILGGWLLDLLFKTKPRLVGAAPALLLLVWIGIEAARAYPNHISYMNQFASSAPHWWYLSDSNVEWGDDLKELARYLHDKGETSVLDGTLGGFGILRFYKIDRVDALNGQNHRGDQPRYLAIGASYLNGSTIPSGSPGTGRETEAGRVNFFDEYRHRTPEAIIGDSIYVFRVR